MPRGVYERGKKASKKADKSTTRDAITYLTHAERSIIRSLREGRAKRITGAELLALLALTTLKGE